MDTILGQMDFNVGFKKKDSINFCGENTDITIKLKAYFEEDGISEEQTKALQKYHENKLIIQEELSQLAVNCDKNAKNRFLPKTLLFGRTGECALLCDDVEEPDEGIAICVFPEKRIFSQDDYL